MMSKFSETRLIYCFFIVLFLICTHGPTAFAQEILSLQKTLEIAMANSPDIRRSKYNLERSQESLNAQKAALKSQFSLTLTPISYTKARQFETFFSTWNTSETKLTAGMFTIRQPIKWTDGTLSLNNRFMWQDVYSEFRKERSKTFSNNLYLSYNQPLFTYNRTMLALKELELDLENSRLSFAIQQLALERQVTQAFYNVYKQKLSHQIALEEYQNQQQSYQIIKNKVDAGLAAKEELYQAELNLSSSKSKVENEKVALENDLDELKRLIGISLFEEISIVADVSHQSVQIDLQQAIDYGLKYRMELRQRQINIENARFDLIRTSAMNEFKGDLTLSYGTIGTNELFDQIYEKPTKNQQVVVSLEIPLFDWGEKRSRIKASEAVLKSRELSLEDEKNDIIISIRQAYRNLNNLETQIELARQNVRNAELTYDINLERYKNGDLTSMDLSLYQNQLSQKKLGLVEALINYKLALLNMKIQSLWDFERNRPVLPEIKQSR